MLVNRKYQPQIEMLEDRTVMDAAGTHVLYQDFIVPTGPLASDAAVTGRITGIAVDPSGNSVQNDPEWRYVAIRRTALVEEPDSLRGNSEVVEGWGSSMYQYAYNGHDIGTANDGVYKSSDGGTSSDGWGNDWISGGTGQDAPNSTRAADDVWVDGRIITGENYTLAA